MAEVLNAPAPVPGTDVCTCMNECKTHSDIEQAKYEWFHSGSGATYRKISENSKGFTEIPTIDISQIDGSLEQRRAIAREVKIACSETGFFYIENTGVPESVTMGVFDLLKQFFELPQETKMTA